MGQVLHTRGIFYAPDYAINAGGVVNVAQEWKGYDAATSRQKTLEIYDTIADMARRSRATGLRPEEIADRMVEEILARAGSQPLVSTMLGRRDSNRPRETV